MLFGIDAKYNCAKERETKPEKYESSYYTEYNL